ncbi:HD domain-containing protein [Streptomyces sp. 8N114]|uniref:HD domain-containing protein n=1 Tax=Streptomyces sp. 8N114 TaxID=3457419 RepID=UPI003FD5C051
MSRALLASTDPPLRPLPSSVTDLLRSLNAPPRLAAHLRAVHDVAYQLVEWTEHRCPDIVVNRDAVLFGAATHDIGKAVHVAELSGPGSAHEEAGREMLLALGFSPDLARFAGTHASWTDPDATFEDLLVSTADKVWKNKRVAELEDLLISRLAHATGQQHWAEYLALDELLEHIGNGADRRLAFQASFPVYA